MSRIGKKPVPMPAGVKVSLDGRAITVEGKLGKLAYTHRPEIGVKVDDDAKAVVCTRSSEDREVRAYHGLTRA
jgi:large subunit ribosomal protein L6